MEYCRLTSRQWAGDDIPPLTFIGEGQPRAAAQSSTQSERTRGDVLADNAKRSVLKVISRGIQHYLAQITENLLILH